LVAARRRLVTLYDAWGKPEKAAEWTKRLSELPPAPATGR
jgi:hypothetical protein